MIDPEAEARRDNALRDRAAALPGEQRQAFYREFGRRVKDPDTYAVLNYFFVAGLHHFYLGKTTRGMINVVLMLVGLLLLPMFAPLGIILLLTVLLIELPQLFKSQRIVFAHNLELMEQILDEVTDEKAL